MRGVRRGGEGIGKVRRVSRGTQGLEAGRGDRGEIGRASCRERV